MSKQIEEAAQAILDAYPGSDPEGVLVKIRTIVARAEGAGLEQATIAELLQSWTVQLPRRRLGWVNADGALADLRRMLVGSKLRRPVLTAALLNTANWILRNWLPVASIVTVVVSGFYGLAYSQFYEELDVSPEQAGLSTAQIIAHSVIGGITLTLVISAVIFLFLVPLAPLPNAPASRSRVGNWVNVAASGVIALGAMLIIGFLSWRTHAPIRLVAPAIGAMLIFALAAGLRIEQKGRRPSFTPGLLEFTLDGYLVLAMLGLTFGVVITGVVTYNEAHHLGVKARDGEAIRNPEIFGVPFLGVKAEPALVAWTRAKPAEVRAPGCALYLGAGDGQDLLYDPQTGSTIEVPRDDVVLSLRRERTTCEAPINVRAPTVHRVGAKYIRCLPGDWVNDAKRSFSYRWTVDGHAFPATFTTSQYLNVEESTPSQVAFCHVKATTPLGADVATSSGIPLGISTVRQRHRAELGGSKVAAR